VVKEAQQGNHYTVIITNLIIWWVGIKSPRLLLQEGVGLGRPSGT